MKPGSWVRWRVGDATLTGRCVEQRGASWAVHVVASVGATPVLSTATVVLPASLLEDSTPILVRPRSEAALTGSFEDTRARVRQAVHDWIEEVSGVDTWIYVVDIGPDWVIYSGYSDDLTMVPYAIEGETVTLGAPVPVTKVTTYVTADPTTATEGSLDLTTGVSAFLSDRVTERIYGRLLAATGTASDGGRIFRVQIIEYGESKNGRHYSEAVLSAAVPLYEGAKAYDHHRTLEEFQTGTVQGIVGYYRNVEATATGLEADLCLLPSATHVAELLDQTLTNQGDGLPLLVGLSHDVMATAKTSIIGGRKVSETTSILKVNSADVVSDPAAGGVAVRMVAGGIDPDAIPPAPLTQSRTTEGSTMKTMKELMAALRVAEGIARLELLANNEALVTANGSTPIGVLRELEAETVLPDPQAGRSTEAEPMVVRDSISGRMLIKEAAGPTLAGFIPMITGLLPEKFKESDLSAEIERTLKMAETFDKVGMKPGIPDVKVTEDERDKKIKALDGFFAQDWKEGYRSFQGAFLDFTGHKTNAFEGDIARTIMQESLGSGFDSAVHQSETLDSTSWAQVLGDSITRRMVAEYARPQLNSWQKVVNMGPPIRDFRTQRITRWGGYGLLPTVAENGTYQPLTSPGDEEATYAVAKKGGTEGISYEAVKNDDVRQISAIPTKLGRAAATTLYRYVWDQFAVSVPTCTYDSVALFNAAHSNTTATALSTTALAATLLAMSLQAGYGDTTDILEIDPKYLVVTPALEQLAWQICTSAVAIPSGAPVGAASDTPNFFQGIEPIVVPYWNATSTTAWFVVGDPQMCPTIEVGFLDGKEQPELFSQSDPNQGSAFAADTLLLKIRHIYGSTVVDHRALSRGNS